MIPCRARWAPRGYATSSFCLDRGFWVPGEVREDSLKEEGRIEEEVQAGAGSESAARLAHFAKRPTLSVYTQPMPEAQAKIASKVARVLLPVAPNSSDVAEMPTKMIQ